MLPYEHFIYGFFVAAGIHYFFPQITVLGAAIIFIVSWGIDVDHYLFYVFKKRDLNLRRAYHFFDGQMAVYRKQGKHYCAPLCIFHTAESLLAMIILSFYNRYVFYVLLGALLHFVGDFYHTFIVVKLPRIRRYTITSYLLKK